MGWEIFSPPAASRPVLKSTPYATQLMQVASSPGVKQSWHENHYPFLGTAEINELSSFSASLHVVTRLVAHLRAQTATSHSPTFKIYRSWLWTNSIRFGRNKVTLFSLWRNVSHLLPFKTELGKGLRKNRTALRINERAYRQIAQELPYFHERKPMRSLYCLLVLFHLKSTAASSEMCNFWGGSDSSAMSLGVMKWRMGIELDNTSLPIRLHIL
jgi:hypothetical protein